MIQQANLSRWVCLSIDRGKESPYSPGRMGGGWRGCFVPPRSWWRAAGRCRGWVLLCPGFPKGWSLSYRSYRCLDLVADVLQSRTQSCFMHKLSNKTGKTWANNVHIWGCSDSGCFLSPAWFWCLIRTILMAWHYVSRQFSPPFPCTSLILSTSTRGASCNTLHWTDPACVCLCVVTGTTAVTPTGAPGIAVPQIPLLLNGYLYTTIAGDLGLPANVQ